MTRLTRINAIIELLRQGPQTVENISEHFGKTVTPRQIREDIKAIKGMGYGSDENFEKTGQANQKTWQIRPSTYDRNTYRLSRGVLPQVFTIKRQESLDKLNTGLLLKDDVIKSSNFYETVAHQQLDTNLELVINAIDNSHKLLLTKLTGDATSVTGLVDFPVIVLPVKIIYHRGCFYVAAVADETRQVLTFQIDQLKLEESHEPFQDDELIERVETDLKKRFGITQNIDDDVYDIQLRFSSVTGEFVKNQFWHDDLTDPIRDGDDWLFTFSCGINRELVGWLFQWMSNVKVIAPSKLKALYDEQLTRIMDVTNQSPDEPLAYSNAFAPNQ